MHFIMSIAGWLFLLTAHQTAGPSNAPLISEDGRPGEILLAAGPELAPGKVVLKSKHKVKKLKEGNKQRTYFKVQALDDFKLRAGGPARLVIQVRGAAMRPASLVVSMDGQETGEIDLGPSKHNSLFFHIPAGTHDIGVMPLALEMIRAVQVKRGPKSREMLVPWKGSSPKTAPPEQVAALPPSGPAALPASSPDTPEPNRPEDPLEKTPRVSTTVPTPSKVLPGQVKLGDGPKSVFVLELGAKGLPAETTATLHGQIASWLAGVPGLTVLTKDDLKERMKFEQDKQLLGCQDDQACLSDLAKGLNADLVLSGSLGTVGTSTVLTLSLIDARKATPISRLSETVADLSELSNALPSLLARLVGSDAQTGPRFKLAQGKTTSFAVLDLAATGVDRDAVRNLTEILSVELKRIQGASVVSRDDLAAMLQLEEQKMLLACTDASCISEIGGALGVDKLVVGQVGKLAERYVVTLRLIDPRSATVDSRVTETFRGQEDQLIRAVRQAGRKLVGVGQGAHGSLSVNANAPEAELVIDREARGKLPQPALGGLSAGLHVVRVAKDGYYDWQSEVYVDPGETTAVWVELSQAPERWYEKWWVWTVAGVVVAGAVTSAVMLTRDDSTPEPYGTIKPGEALVNVQSWGP